MMSNTSSTDTLIAMVYVALAMRAALHWLARYGNDDKSRA
jgi:hypothetical protein